MTYRAKKLFHRALYHLSLLAYHFWRLFLSKSLVWYIYCIFQNHIANAPLYLLPLKQTLQTDHRRIQDP
jgi:hypothetical protein